MIPWKKASGIWQAAVSLPKGYALLAGSKLKMRGPARGREGSEWERDSSCPRKELNLAGAKAYSSCLMGTVARVGEEHRQASKRRAWIKMEGERREKESRAQLVSNVQRRKFFRGRGQCVTE